MPQEIRVGEVGSETMSPKETRRFPARASASKRNSQAPGPLLFLQSGLLEGQPLCRRKVAEKLQDPHCLPAGKRVEA